MAEAGGAALKDQGNALFKAGNYLKAAALYTQAIKLDPSNPTLYSNRCAAFLNLVKLSKALVDAETTISLNPQWEKGYFRKGCVLEAMERYEDAVAAFQVSLQYNPQSTEVSKRIKRLTQLAREKDRALEAESIRSNVDMAKYLDPMKTELQSAKHGSAEECQDIFSFVVGTLEAAIKNWHETGKVDPRVYFLLDKEKTQTDKYAPVVNIDKAFESPHTHSSCFSFLRQYAEESYSKAACLVTPKKIISYPQVWKGEGSRKWKHGSSDGFFVQFESLLVRKLWFIPSSTEMGRTLCRDPAILDIGAHEVLPRIFKEPFPAQKQCAMPPASLALLRPIPQKYSLSQTDPKNHFNSKPPPPAILTGAPPRLRSLRQRCVPEDDDGVSGMVEELLSRAENQALLEGLDAASLRVDRARAALADIEMQEAEALRAKEYTTQIEGRLSEISESQKELLEARAMVDEAERALSLNMEGSGFGERSSEVVEKDIERLESVKAALVASTIGTLASLPISLYQLSSSGQLILHLIIICISCALFGVTFRYTIRRDLDNIQLKTGTSAAFGFVKGLAELSSDRTLQPDVSSLISLSVDGAVSVAENVFVFLSAAVALDFCFKMRLLSPFPVRK